MQFKKTKTSLEVQLTSDFNLNAVQRIKQLMGDRDSISIDLSQANFVNSEAIIFMHELIKNEKTVRLKDPPKIFYEALRILGLHDIWNLKSIVEPT